MENSAFFIVCALRQEAQYFEFLFLVHFLGQLEAWPLSFFPFPYSHSPPLPFPFLPFPSLSLSLEVGTIKYS